MEALFLALVSSVAGHTQTLDQLKQHYGSPVFETFKVSNSVGVKVKLRADGVISEMLILPIGPDTLVESRACTLILRGSLSGDQVLHFFDVLVPTNVRGAKKNEPFWCVNVCQHVIVYQNVTLLTGATANQTSEPAAIITFRRADCKAAVANANKTVLDIKK